MNVEKGLRGRTVGWGRLKPELFEGVGVPRLLESHTFTFVYETTKLKRPLGTDYRGRQVPMTPMTGRRTGVSEQKKRCTGWFYKTVCFRRGVFLMSNLTSIIPAEVLPIL